MKNEWKRRDFLRTVGIAGLLAPVATYWEDLPEARALTSKRNMVLVYLPNGKTRGNPFVSGSGGSWRYEQGFEPYNAFRNRSIAIEQYSFQQFVDRHYSGDNAGHCANGTCMYTGEVAYAPGGRASGGIAPSIDQIVAWDYLNRGVITNPLRKSLAIKMTGSSFRSPSVFFQTPSDYTLNRTYRSEVPPLNLEGSPRDGFVQMFGDLAEMGGGTVEQLWLHGRSILDVPAAELASLRPTLPAEGRALLDQHLQGLRDLERGLAAEDAEAPITVPDPPDDVDDTPGNHERIWSQWVQIIDAAFRLDRTRIASIQFGGIASRFQVPSLGLGRVGGSQNNSGSDHHSYTHHAPDRVPLFMNWYAERVAELLTELTGSGATPKPDILQDSVVMVGMEFGWNHQSYDVPITLFGEGGGYFAPGRVVRYGNDLSHFHQHTGTLLAVAHAMGTEGLELVGRDNADYQRGPSSELRA